MFTIFILKFYSNLNANRKIYKKYSIPQSFRSNITIDHNRNVIYVATYLIQDQSSEQKKTDEPERNKKALNRNLEFRL